MRWVKFKTKMLGGCASVGFTIVMEDSRLHAVTHTAYGTANLDDPLDDPLHFRLVRIAIAPSAPLPSDPISDPWLMVSCICACADEHDLGAVCGGLLCHS